MSEQEPSITDLMETIKNMSGIKGESAWERKTKKPKTDIQSVSIPLSLDTDQGKIRVYVSFPGDAASSPETLFALVEDLAEKGFPLDIWQGKSNWKKRSW